MRNYGEFMYIEKEMQLVCVIMRLEAQLNVQMPRTLLSVCFINQSQGNTVQTGTPERLTRLVNSNVHRLPGQPFRSQFVLYRTDIGLIKQTINKTSQCNKVDAVRLYASYRCRFTFTKWAEVRVHDVLFSKLKLDLFKM